MAQLEKVDRFRMEEELCETETRRCGAAKVRRNPNIGILVIEVGLADGAARVGRRDAAAGVWTR